jgi:hypothetical protein
LPSKIRREIMKRSIIMVISIIFIFVPMAQAENPVDSTAYVSGDMAMVHADAEVMVMSYELKGLVLSNNNSEILNNASERCVGVFKRIGSEIVQNGYCKYLYPNKDYMILGFNGGADGGKWEILFGTGKWKGITGSGTYNVKRVQPITPNSLQHSRTIKGTYELPE